jgi:hypothetical protein
MIPIFRHAVGLSVISILIEPHGVLGLHPAAADQLLLVATEKHSSPHLTRKKYQSIGHGDMAKGEIHQMRRSNRADGIVIECRGWQDRSTFHRRHLS